MTLGAGLGAVALALIGGWVLLRRRRSAAIDALCRQNVSLPVDGPRAFAERYEVLRPLLRDVHGEILEARDRTLDRRVEIRRLHAGPDAALRERGLAAARTAAGLKHPAIAAIYEVAQEGPHVLVVREWLGGKTARAMLKEGGRLPLAQALLLLRRACEAVAFAHGQGVTHQWLSPESVVVTDQGEAKVSDFGLMPAGASPGEAGGLQDVERRKRGDVHDLAVCLYELVTGAKPFPDGAADGSAGLGLIAPSIRVPGLPPALDEILSDALAATPEPRIQSPAELLARLGEVQEVAGKR